MLQMVFKKTYPQAKCNSKCLLFFVSPYCIVMYDNLQIGCWHEQCYISQRQLASHYTGPLFLDSEQKLNESEEFTYFSVS